MATVTTVARVDDIDGAANAETVSFALDGVSYEIDLSARNAGKLRDALATYIAHGRKTSGRRVSAGRVGRARATSGLSRDETTLIRNWARENGHTVSDRGRLSASVVEAYRAAH